jgi:hypothetical protein
MNSSSPRGYPEAVSCHFICMMLDLVVVVGHCGRALAHSSEGDASVDEAGMGGRGVHPLKCSLDFSGGSEHGHPLEHLTRQRREKVP